MELTKKTKIFIDASIFIAAIGSKTGGSALILEACCKGRFISVTTELVLKETRKNIRDKFGQEALINFYKFFLTLKSKICWVDQKEAEKKFSHLLNKKDVHVLAGAILSRSDFLLTLDKKHFFNKEMKRAKLDLIIVTPEMFIKDYLKAYVQ